MSTKFESLQLKQTPIFELDIECRPIYADPFNDVDVDVVFTRGREQWRVPTFWRGDHKWTARFFAPMSGEYRCWLESTDPHNSDLNGHDAIVTIATAAENNEDLFTRGKLRVSADKRFFEHEDGSPFFWLGDTWWTGLSDRLPWEAFKTLARDRKEKGFTVVQICAGLVPSNEELAPIDPGFCNEGGHVWDPHFERINPAYFDFADRRIQHLIEIGIVPVIVGAWRQALSQMGVNKMKKHWRYIVARYAAYPVFWIGAGEVYDPPAERIDNDALGLFEYLRTPGWTEVIRYIRAVDPYKHPLSVHEVSDVSLQDPSLTDFDFAQPGHAGWCSIGTQVAQLNMRYSRREVIKPFVVAEVGYEMIGNTHLQDFQRVAFWLAMLNGAAGHSYGAAPTYEANNPDKPLHRFGQYTFLSWEEGMHLPGSYQIGLASKLLRKYPWWQFKPHPEWVTPRGATLLEPRDGINGFDLGDYASIVHKDWTPTDEFMRSPEASFPGGEWKAAGGSFRYPYAAGIPCQVRVFYIPYFGLLIPPPPTVLDLEQGVIYRAYYWEPTLGIKFDLGAVALPKPGKSIFTDHFREKGSTAWQERGPRNAVRYGGRLVAMGETMSIVENICSEDIVVSIEGHADAGAGLILRYQNHNNYVAVIYSHLERSLYICMHSEGEIGRRMGVTAVPELTPRFRLKAEVRSNMAAASISDGSRKYSTPIVDLLETSHWADPTREKIRAGAVGLYHPNENVAQSFENFEVHESPGIPEDNYLERKLYDARGTYRGELSGPRWRDFGRIKSILLNAYRPERFPSLQDWVLVLET